MLNRKKTVKMKSFIESKITALSEIRTWTSKEQLRQIWNSLSKFLNFNLVKICFNKTLKYFIVRIFRSTVVSEDRDNPD